jgi:hypothetical protein
MRWDVVNADREDGGGVVIGGMTSGSEPLWQNQFWFELGLDDTPPVIQYWATAPSGEWTLPLSICGRPSRCKRFCEVGA